MKFERKVRKAWLPEMRVAYMEQPVASEDSSIEDYLNAYSELWQRFNEWRERTRPALGRIDVAALAWTLRGDDGHLLLRAAVPIRGDYQAPPEVRTAIFPGGTFLYCYADDSDEIDLAFQAVNDELERGNYEPASGPIEAYKFSYNFDQHPADCGYLVKGDRPTGYGGHHAPLPIARG